MFTFLASGERALGAHEEPADRAFQPGEIWRVDLGARFFERINSDLARTGVVGEASERQQEILGNVLAAQAAGFGAVAPGRPASGVFEAVKTEFERREMPFQMPHVGHGLGGGLHEFPILHPMNEAPLEPGMVLAIEPMLKFPERGECYHVEDLLVVTDDGFELLTEPQRGLLEIKL
jgi:Xaa-Pro aminopeptidase